ncbi:MAG TPA: apolipoprotein N-acyltransferase [Gemmatimonadaceae bacterium]|nr:apolipoprotein N-acyltransferase [Gemmatimonadaceae bacterium]
MRRWIILPSRGEALAAAAAALLFALSFPPFPLLVPAFLCLTPLAVIIARDADAGVSPRVAARLGFWFGLLAYACTLYWIAIALSLYTKLAVLGYVGAVAWLAPIVALAMAVLSALRRATRAPMAVLLPIVWVSLEVVLNYTSDLSFPWLPLGLATSRFPMLAQIADLSGVRGTSFWIAATNGLIADAWLLRGSRRAIAVRAGLALTLLTAVAAYGAWRMRTIALRTVAPIAVIQPNIPQEDKWQEENQSRIVGILAGLTREHLAGTEAQLVVWPEVALPGYFADHPDWSDTLAALARPTGIPILFGVLDVQFHGGGDYDYYNAAMLTDARGRVGVHPPYRKEFLVPVIERVPFLNPDWFKGMRYFGGYGRGNDPPPMRLGFGSIGVLICYESVFPQLSREYRRKGVDVLVNITNDAWFGRSIAPHQHESHIAIRAIENRVGIVRSANTGISEYVDPLGRRHDPTPLFTPETRTYRAETTDVRSPYVRIGDWAGTLSLAGVLVLLAVDGWRRRRARA